MTNNNIKLDSKDLGRAALAWQSPNLVKAAGHEVRSTLWMFVIFSGLFGATGIIWNLYQIPFSEGPSRQEIQDFMTAQKNVCISKLVAQGYSAYGNNNCPEVASTITYNRYGRLP